MNALSSAQPSFEAVFFFPPQTPMTEQIHFCFIDDRLQLAFRTNVDFLSSLSHLFLQRGRKLQKCANPLFLLLLPSISKIPSPVLAEAHHAAVILVPAPFVQHAGVDDVAHGDVQVVGTQVLQQLQRLISSRLGTKYNIM